MSIWVFIVWGCLPIFLYVQKKYFIDHLGQNKYLSQYTESQDMIVDDMKREKH